MARQDEDSIGGQRGTSRGTDCFSSESLSPVLLVFTCSIHPAEKGSARFELRAEARLAVLRARVGRRSAVVARGRVPILSWGPSGNAIAAARERVKKCQPRCRFVSARGVRCIPLAPCSFDELPRGPNDGGIMRRRT